MAKDKRVLTIQQALEWAFRNECAQLSLPERMPVEERGRGFGTEYVLMQRMKLGGVRIDTSFGSSSPHDDAENIAAAVTNIREDLGGYRMAITLSECARTGITPDWMPDAKPKIEPREWGRANRFGQMAKTEVLRRYTQTTKTPHPKNPKRFIERRVEVTEDWCPCRWVVSLQQIETARADYQAWRTALLSLMDLFSDERLLSSIRISDALPPDRPWRRKIRLANRRA